MKQLSQVILTLALLVPAFAQNKTAIAPKGTFEISGTLVDSITGQPISRARVALAPVTQRDDQTTLITAEDGRFSFPSLTAGKYSLSAQAHGYLLQSFNQHDEYSSAIVVGTGLAATGLLFRLPPESSISGVVIDEAGEPVREAQVMLYFTGLARGSDATRLVRQVAANDEGSYHFGHLPPGRYLIAVSAKPWYAQHAWSNAGQSQQDQTSHSGVSASVTTWRGGALATPSTESNPQLDVAYPVMFYPGVTEPSSATPLKLASGEKATADFTLQPVPAIRIIINQDQTDSTGNGYLALQHRVLDGPPMPVQAENRLVSPGVVEVVGLPAGHYTVRNYVVGQAQSEWTSSREIDVTSTGEINPSEGTQYVPVSAKLQVSSGSLPRQVYVGLLNKATNEMFLERASASGELSFKQGIKPGQYEMSLAGPINLYLAGTSAEGAKVSGRTVEIRNGSPAKLNITLAHGEAEITGTAQREGKPFAGAMIVLVPDDPGHNLVLFRRDQSDSDGTFALPRVVPGNYKLLAIEKGWDLEWTNPDVLEKFMAAAAPVHAQANGKYSVKVNVQ